MWKRLFSRDKSLVEPPKFSLLHHYSGAPGEILYHYTTLAAAASIVHNDCFWLTEFQKTNDSTEYEYAKEQYINAYQNREVWIDDLVRFMTTANLIGLEANTHMLIGCLTQRPDDLSQWRAYGDDGEGCVVGIDANWLEESAGVAIRRVNYDAKYLREFVNVGLAVMQTMYEKNPANAIELKEFCRFFLSDLYAFKHPSFRDEAEVRISRMTIVNEDVTFGLVDNGGTAKDGTPTDPLVVKTRETAHGSARYVGLPLSSPNRRSSIRTIGFGPKCSDDQKQSVLDALEFVPGGITTWDSEIPYR